MIQRPGLLLEDVMSMIISKKQNYRDSSLLNLMDTKSSDAKTTKSYFIRSGCSIGVKYNANVKANADLTQWGPGPFD